MTTNAAANTSLAVNAPLVVSETMDGEAIVMHHGSGRYFDMTGSAALIWSAVEQGASHGQIAEALVQAYALAPAAAQATAQSFLQTLESHDLLRAADAPAPTSLDLPTVIGPYAPPLLGVHDDLADMLLLDPIHDVDDVGWPAPRPLDAAK